MQIWVSLIPPDCIPWSLTGWILLYLCVFVCLCIVCVCAFVCICVFLCLSVFVHCVCSCVCVFAKSCISEFQYFYGLACTWNIITVSVFVYLCICVIADPQRLKTQAWRWIFSLVKLVVWESSENKLWLIEFICITTLTLRAKQCWVSSQIRNRSWDNAQVLLRSGMHYVLAVQIIVWRNMCCILVLTDMLCYMSCGFSYRLPHWKSQ